MTETAQKTMYHSRVRKRDVRPKEPLTKKMKNRNKTGKKKLDC